MALKSNVLLALGLSGVIAGFSYGTNTADGARPLLPPADTSFKSATLLFHSKDTAYNIRLWQGIPTVEVLPDGSLWVAWYSGGKTEGVGNYITMAESTTSGASWKKNVVIVAPPEKQRVFDPCLWYNEDEKKLCLFWAQSKNAIWDGEGGVWMVQKKLNSPDTAWSRPRRLSDGVMLNKPAQLNGGSAILPIAYWDKLSPAFEAPKNPAKTGASVYSLKGDQVRSAGRIKINKQEEGISEHQIVSLKDGTLWALIRTRSGISESRSTNQGKSWSQAAPFTRIGPVTSSRFHVQKLQSGRLLLVVNASTARTNMAALLSEDDGKTWPYKLVIDNRSNVSYPDATEDNKGNIYIVYDRERSTAKEILMVKLNERMIMDNSVGEGKAQINKMIIDKGNGN